MTKHHYSENIDPHIYIPGPNRCQTVEDWIELAIAALDQAGFYPSAQDKVRALVNDLRKPC